jgi:prophage antirepressor-like protein
MELISKIDETLSFDKDQIRILGTAENPMFVSVDVCKILGLSNVSQALTIIPDKWKGIILNDTHGGKQNMSVVNESGLYKLIMRSRKPIAEKFQEWVCETVLPSIRKKGEFVLTEYKKQLAETQNKVKELSSNLVTEQNMVIRLKKSVSQYCKKFSFYHSFKELPAIYIISDPSKFNQSELKIGFTENINNRLASDRCMIPNLRLEFLMYTPFAVEFEKIIKIRYREQFSNNNHEWLIEPLEDLIKFYQRVNKLLQLNGVEDSEVWKYNMDEQEIEEYEKKNPKKEESIEDLPVVKREKEKIAATIKRKEEMKEYKKKQSEEKSKEQSIIKDEEKVEENIIEKSSLSEDDEQDYESESEDGKELRPYAIGPKTEILSKRLKKILPGWLSKSQYNEKNKKAPKDQRFCNAWCQQFVDILNYRGIRSGGLLPICKKCENMEDIARIKIHNGQSTIEQIKLNPVSLLCNENEQACRQCWKIKNVKLDFEPLNRKCRTCKLTNQKERISNISFMDTIASLKEFSKTPNLKKIDLELRLKSVSKEEFVLILKELKLGRASTDKKEDMIQRMVKYLLA